jgi:hypothetical protein
LVSKNPTAVALPDTLQISDLEGNAQTVTVTATGGTVSVSAMDGLDFLGGSDGTDDVVMTFWGSLDDVNAALDSLTFTPTLNMSGPASIQIASDDGLVGGHKQQNTCFLGLGRPSCCVDRSDWGC